MIKKLDASYRESLFKFLKEKPEINLFIIGDVENYGFDMPFQEVWAEFDTQGNYLAVLLRYKVHFVFSAAVDTYNSELFSTIIKNSLEKNVVSGELSAISGLAAKMNFKKHKEMYFAKLTKLAPPPTEANWEVAAPVVEKATPDDAEDIYALRNLIDEFSDVRMSVDSIRENLSGTFARTWCIRRDGKIVSAASTTAENSSSAMVVAVMTHPQYRRLGLAAACVTELCRTLLSEGKTLCLFYDNPDAGRIYKQIGFEDIGKWVMLIL